MSYYGKFALGSLIADILLFVGLATLTGWLTQSNLTGAVAGLVIALMTLGWLTCLVLLFATLITFAIWMDED